MSRLAAVKLLVLRLLIIDPTTERDVVLPHLRDVAIACSSFYRFNSIFRERAARLSLLIFRFSSFNSFCLDGGGWGIRLIGREEEERI